MVYAPIGRDGREFGWARMVIDEMAVFPKGKSDDLTDAMTQGVNYLRGLGYASTDDEVEADRVAAATPRRQLKALYPV
jgi:phage terminase large subunit-like protein